MDAMILAAGYGSRLRPLTDHTPKPLVEVGGAPMIEHIARRLIAAGVDRIIVNISHLAEVVEEYARERWSLDAELILSREPSPPLGTGGALVHARHHFRGDAPFILHVGDVVSDVDLAGAMADHRASGALATLLVQDRGAERSVLFDERGLLGRDHRGEGWERRVREPVGPVRRWSFAGIHVIEPELLGRIHETPPFDIVDLYLRLAAEGAVVRPLDVTGVRWLEMGTPERLEAARRVLASEDGERGPRLGD